MFRKFIVWDMIHQYRCLQSLAVFCMGFSIGAMMAAVWLVVMGRSHPGSTLNITFSVLGSCLIFRFASDMLVMAWKYYRYLRKNRLFDIPVSNVVKLHPE